MKFHLLLLCCFGFLALTAQAAAPTSDELYGILTVVGGENTETIIQTVSIDIDSGDINTLVTNFIYAGSSVFFDGISSLDDKKQNLYYATDAASAFVYSANVRQKVLNPPIDVGAVEIIDLKMNTLADTLYIEFADTNSVLIATYSTNGGPANLLVNLTDVLLAQGGVIGRSTLDIVNDVWYFLTYTQTGYYLNSLYLNNLTSVGNLLDPICEKGFDFLFTDPTTKTIYGVMEVIRAGKVHYTLATLNSSGACNETVITHEPEGIITAFTYSPYSNNLYYAVATDSGNFVCYYPLPLTGKPTCTAIDNVLSDLEVAYPK